MLGGHTVIHEWCIISAATCMRGGRTVLGSPYYQQREERGTRIDYSIDESSTTGDENSPRRCVLDCGAVAGRVHGAIR